MFAAHDAKRAPSALVLELLELDPALVQQLPLVDAPDAHAHVPAAALCRLLLRLGELVLDLLRVERLADERHEQGRGEVGVEAREGGRVAVRAVLALGLCARACAGLAHEKKKKKKNGGQWAKEERGRRGGEGERRQTTPRPRLPETHT